MPSVSHDRADLLTEQQLPASACLDQLSTTQALALFAEQDRQAVEAVARIATDVATMVERVAQALARGGRLFYVGAGTSGRLGVLDAAECPPTFGSDPSQVQAIIAGGEGAVFRAVEGAEDDAAAGAAAIDDCALCENDVLLGIAAGGTTPFVAGAIHQARSRGAFAALLTCAQHNDHEPPADLVLRPLTGPEILTGSTRLKAGTASKLVLNQISTLSMVRLGKCYGNLMVDLRASNAKLRDRAQRMVMTVCRIDRGQAAAVLDQADGHVKTAIVMQRRSVTAAEAATLLNASNGDLRRVIDLE